MDLLPKDLSVPVRSCQARQKKKNQDKTLFLCLFPVRCFTFTESNEGKNILPSYHQLDCLKCSDSRCSKFSTDSDGMSSEMTHEIKFNCSFLTFASEHFENHPVSSCPEKSNYSLATHEWCSSNQVQPASLCVVVVMCVGQACKAGKQCVPSRHMTLLWIHATTKLCRFS